LEVTIRPLEARDIAPIANAFAAMGWNKPAAQYERYLAEQREGRREVLVAFVEDGSAFAGYLTSCGSRTIRPCARRTFPRFRT
jgi:hypothetical protein